VAHDTFPLARKVGKDDFLERYKKNYKLEKAEAS